MFLPSIARETSQGRLGHKSYPQKKVYLIGFVGIHKMCHYLACKRNNIAQCSKLVSVPKF